jgi:RNA polymerase sigma-70 factor (ECF subfamily)
VDQALRAEPIPHRVAEPVEDRIDVAKRIEALPDRQREVLLLRYYQQMSEREIAEVVGIPQGTVKSRLHNAIRTLRRAEEKSHGGS